MKKLILITYILLLSSCGVLTYHDWSTYKYGIVREVKTSQVCVEYKVRMENGKDSKKPAFNCYYHEEGHYYQLGDTYPSFDKH